MNTQTVLLLLLAAVVSLSLVVFQYYYANKRKDNLRFWLSGLRFIVFFGGFVLLINPQLTKIEYQTEKANLLVLIDNSSSISQSEGTVTAFLDALTESTEIGNKFEVQQYRFGTSIENSDSLTFDDTNTNISSALNTLKEIYASTNSVILLVSDGNQTLGRDYEYIDDVRFPIYPIAIGDTTRYEDLAIKQVNANRYAFLDNKFPIEILVSYEGDEDITTPLNVSINGSTTYRETVSLSKNTKAKIINVLLDANSVGVKTIEISTGTLPGERITANNKKSIAVEVIDEKTNVTIISEFLHPDLGVLKKAIESNEQRSVSIFTPKINAEILGQTDLFILYQPTPAFNGIYDFIKQNKVNMFTITGEQTDWNFLNSIQKRFAKKDYAQTEEIEPILNPAFGLFDLQDFSIEGFPPLLSSLGEISLNGPNDIVMTQKIKGISIEEPLLVVFKDNTDREAVLFGQNIWKWRMQTYRNDQNFIKFDDFLGKIILYLTTNATRDRLTIDYNSVYEGSSEARISASYFDDTFVFDGNATVVLTFKKQQGPQNVEIPMLLKDGYYEADLSSLSPGKYDFRVSVNNGNISKSGSFTILDFDVEQQFLATDYRKLERLAQSTGGQLYFPSQTEQILERLKTDNRFVPIRKGIQNIVSLIDFWILLAIITTALTLEWVIRKYNGLI
ncbi:vWA domain-containing protein [Pareuzebyella sediminis]|uniref:vWA domain-containing protein n=1 Tax=Pareuzebyella sediminis TaxID=2607998 RepID=UPI0011ED3B24|nr:vWA domain-containing protein [Pareuzebyella sediminis]